MFGVKVIFISTTTSIVEGHAFVISGREGPACVLLGALTVADFLRQAAAFYRFSFF